MIQALALAFLLSGANPDRVYVVVPTMTVTLEIMTAAIQDDPTTCLYAQGGGSVVLKFRRADALQLGLTGKVLRIWRADNPGRTWISYDELPAPMQIHMSQFLGLSRDRKIELDRRVVRATTRRPRR